MKDPIVSVIMPAYNCAQFIQKAINSVLIQDVPLELIIINDCSTDDTETVIMKNLPNSTIRYIKNKTNMGVARTRNKGVRYAKGKYVAFLDSDDWWENGKLKKQLELLDKTGMVLCSTGRRLVDYSGKSLNKIIPVKEVITYSMLLGHNSINCSSVVVKRQVALEYPMEHPDSHEDYITWLKILQKYGSCRAINQPLLNYRLSAKGKSGNKLHSAKMTFRVYRYMGFGLGKSIICFVRYAVNGVMKYW